MRREVLGALLFLIFALLIALGLSIVWYSWRYGISPMPTSIKVRSMLMRQLPAAFTGTIFELGSGWGTLAFPLAQKYPGAKIIGIEISLVPYLFSCLRLFLQRRTNLSFARKDFFSCSLSEADLIVCYLYPKAMERLSAKFKRELKDNTLIISHTFALPLLKPEQIVKAQDLYHTPIYFYKWRAADSK